MYLPERSEGVLGSWLVCVGVTAQKHWGDAGQLRGFVDLRQVVQIVIKVVFTLEHLVHAAGKQGNERIEGEQ